MARAIAAQQHNRRRVGPASIYARTKNLRSNLRERAITRSIGVKGAELFPLAGIHTHGTYYVGKQSWGKLARPVFRIIYPLHNEGRKEERILCRNCQ